MERNQVFQIFFCNWTLTPVMLEKNQGRPLSEETVNVLQVFVYLLYYRGL
jgi:hypothetical protein